MESTAISAVDASKTYLPHEYDSKIRNDEIKKRVMIHIILSVVLRCFNRYLPVLIRLRSIPFVFAEYGACEFIPYVKNTVAA